MPAKSRAMRIVAAIAEHDPDKLYDRNKGMASMDQQDLHDFASTKETNLPQYANAKTVYPKKKPMFGGLKKVKL